MISPIHSSSKGYIPVNGSILDLHPESVEQNSVTRPYVPDTSVNSLKEDLIEGTEDDGNKQVVGDGFGEPIDNYEYDIMQVLEGHDFEHTQYPENITFLSRGTKIVYLFTIG